MFGIISTRVGYNDNGKKYGFIVYREKSEYLFVLLEGEPYYNTFMNIDGELSFANMCDNTRLIESYTYSSEDEFLLAIKKARKEWMLHNKSKIV